MSIDAFLQTAGLLPEALLLVSGDGMICAANRAGAEQFGVAPGALRGQPLAGLIADEPEMLHRYLRACARTRSLLPGTLRLRMGVGWQAVRAEGALFRPATAQDGPLILLRLSPKDAAVARFVELSRRIGDLSREIARRRHAEDELREQHEWFRVVLTSIGDAVIATDASARVLFMNPVAELLTGWPQAEAAHRPLRDIFRIVNEETRHEVENPAEKVLREERIVGLANHTLLIARDGTEWPIDDSAAPIRSDSGAIRGVVLIFREIGVRRRMERELRHRATQLVEADRRKDEFLAMLAHELRNPMAPLSNVLAVLRESDAEGSELGWGLEILERQVRHMARLVDDLLDVSRVTLGKIALQRRRVALAEVIGDALEIARPLIEERRHELTVTLPEAPVALEADPARLAQILANLLNNAAKYTEEGGRIWLEVEPQAGWVELRVRDTGIGIEPALLGEVFELFTQSEAGLARSLGGLGIGLALVRALVELHGGCVEACSDGPGRGSEFIVRLPVATAPPPAAAAAAPGRPRAGEARRVLVVDDSLDSAHSLARLLGRWGHTIHVVHDGPAALDAARAFQPEVVLLDIGLPGMDGYEVAAHLRREDPDGAVLVVGLSGYGQDRDRRRAQEAGFDAYLVKPVDPGALVRVLSVGYVERHCPPATLEEG